MVPYTAVTTRHETPRFLKSIAGLSNWIWRRGHRSRGGLPCKKADQHSSRNDQGKFHLRHSRLQLRANRAGKLRMKSLLTSGNLVHC